VNYTKTKPCDNCPFRKDKPFPLPADRVEEIRDGLQRGEFACHKTTVDNDESEGCRIETDKSLHCAGALILMEKIQEPSQMMRICERLGFYDHTKLDMKAPVYDSWDEMIESCARANTRPAKRRRE
jgi:hypothetical protein